MNRINGLASNQYFVSLLKKASTIIFGFIALAFLSRAMGPTIKGEYDTYLNIVNILNVLLNLGVSTVYPNYIRNREKWTETTFILFSIIQFCIYALLSVLAGLFSSSAIVLMIGLCITSSVFAIQLNNISLVENYIYNAVANIVSVIINATLAAIVFFEGMHHVYLIMSIYCVKEITVPIVALFLLRKDVSIREADFSKIVLILKRGFIPMLTNLLIMVNYRIDVIFLNLYHVAFYNIGLYTAGLGIAEYAWIVPDIFKDVLINKTARDDSLDSVKFCLRASSSFLIVSYFVLLVFGKIAISVLYGKAFLDAYQVTTIVFIGVYGMVYCKLLGTLYLAQGKWNFYFYTLLGAVIINVIANNVFIPILGINGAAITTVIAYSFAGLVFLFHFKKKYKFSFSELLILNKNDYLLIKSLIKRIKAN